MKILDNITTLNLDSQTILRVDNEFEKFLIRETNIFLENAFKNSYWENYTIALWLIFDSSVEKYSFQKKEYAKKQEIVFYIKILPQKLLSMEFSSKEFINFWILSIQFLVEKYKIKNVDLHHLQNNIEKQLAFYPNLISQKVALF